MAYADFLTAMIALFIMLWLLNSSKQVQDAVGVISKIPPGPFKKVGSDMAGHGENFVLSKDNLEALKEQLQKAIRAVPNFDKLRNHIDMTVTNEGLRIELLESAKRHVLRYWQSGIELRRLGPGHQAGAGTYEIAEQAGRRRPYKFETVIRDRPLQQLGAVARVRGPTLAQARRAPGSHQSASIPDRALSSPSAQRR